VVQLLDISRMHAEVDGAIRKALLGVYESGQYILGPWVPQLETQLAAWLGVPFAVGVSSGTDALVAALDAVGFAPGGQWITTPFTFVATADAIVRAGGVPVFVDVDEDTLLVDPEQVDAACGPRTAGLLPVHLFGQCADLDALLAIAGARSLPLIEDNAQAMGALWHGRQAGSLGRFGCFSFFPSKNLGCLGDGGLVTAQTEADAIELRALRAHGSKKKYHHDRIGGNYRLDSLQAAVLLAKLPSLEAWNRARQEVAARYHTLLEQAGLVSRGLLRPLGLNPGSTHVFHQFVVRAKDRDALAAHLGKHNIGNAIYYPVPLHLQRCFANLGYREGSFPVAEKACREVIALPIFPGLTQAEQEEVVGRIASFYGA
jgi:dTDP-4-amino-4,6-dideoxygalactose transaminase